MADVKIWNWPLRQKLILMFLIALVVTISVVRIQHPQATVVLQSPFPDVPTESSTLPAIQHLYDQGIITGGADGLFHPDQLLNRAEFATLLVRLSGIEPQVDEYRSCFPDVGTEWFAPAVCFAKEQGWIQGYASGEEAGYFVPSGAVQDIEILTMLSRLMDWPVQKEGEWFEPALHFADSYGIYDVLQPIQNLNREETAQVLFRTLTTDLPRGSVSSVDFLMERASSSEGSVLYSLESEEKIVEQLLTTISEEIERADQEKDAEERVAALGYDSSISDFADVEVMYWGKDGKPQIGNSLEREWNTNGLALSFDVRNIGGGDLVARVLLHNPSSREWLYAYDEERETTAFPGEVTGEDELHFSFAIHHVLEMHEGVSLGTAPAPLLLMPKPLAAIDSEEGFVFEIESQGKKYLIGSVGEQVQVGDEDDVSVLIQKHIKSFSVIPKSCKCEGRVDIQDAFTKVFEKMGIEFSFKDILIYDPKDVRYYGRTAVHCNGDALHGKILFGENYEVLPNELQARFRENSLPQSQQEVRYILMFRIDTFCKSPDCLCACRVRLRFYDKRSSKKLLSYESGVECSKLEEELSMLFHDLEQQLNATFIYQDPKYYTFDSECCKGTSVKILDVLVDAFKKMGLTVSGDHIRGSIQRKVFNYKTRERDLVGTSDFSNEMECGFEGDFKQAKIVMRLSDTFKVLPNYKTVRRRFEETGKLQERARYILIFDISAHCKYRQCVCTYAASYKVLDIITDVIMTGDAVMFRKYIASDLQKSLEHFLNDLEDRMKVELKDESF